MKNVAETVRQAIPVYQDWPKAGIQYKNTVELCRDPTAFADSIRWFSNLATHLQTQDIFAADARGFIWGSATAHECRLPLHVVRKPGKVPGPVWSQEYALEYGTDTLELMQSVPQGNRRVMVIDDVLATGGTALAICKLLNRHLGIAMSNITVATVVNLTFLGGEKLLKDNFVFVKGLVNE
jgi:adenine phosphoribosyltransferase